MIHKVFTIIYKYHRVGQKFRVRGGRKVFISHHIQVSKSGKNTEWRGGRKATINCLCRDKKLLQRSRQVEVKLSERKWGGLMKSHSKLVEGNMISLLSLNYCQCMYAWRSYDESYPIIMRFLHLPMALELTAIEGCVSG